MDCQRQSNGERLMGCIVYNPHWLQTTMSFVVKMGELYTYIIRGAFGVARFDNPGNAKALTRGTSDRTGSTFSFVYINHLYN